MNSTNNPPDVDPVNYDTLAGGMTYVFKKLLQQVNGMLPAQVIDYDRVNNRVRVQLLITMITTTNQQVPRSQLASIPVINFGGGGFMLNFNLNAGDLGWVLASDRDVSLFLQGYSQSPPNTNRMFNFADGVFIPHIMNGYTLAGDDITSGNAVLQNLDGTVKISLSQTAVTITAPTVTIAGALNPTEGMTVTGGGATPFTMTGNMRVVGNITASGSITPNVP